MQECECIYLEANYSFFMDFHYTFIKVQIIDIKTSHPLLSVRGGCVPSPAQNLKTRHTLAPQWQALLQDLSSSISLSKLKWDLVTCPEFSGFPTSLQSAFVSLGVFFAGINSLIGASSSF